MINTINKEDFDILKTGNNLKVLKIGAEWCSACKAIHPIMDKMSEDNSNVDFYDMDADKNQDFVVNLGIKSLPSFIFYKEGKEILIEKGLNYISLKKRIQEFQ